MKRFLIPILFSLFTFCATLPLFAQQLKEQQNKEFTGANPKLSKYKVLYVLSSNDEKHVTHLLKNMRNALSDPRLKGKLELELVVFGEGFSVYNKTGPYEAQLKELKELGVILAQCQNSITARNIDKATLFPFISYVPSAQGEIIIRAADKWVVIQP